MNLFSAFHFLSLSLLLPSISLAADAIPVVRSITTSCNQSGTVVMLHADSATANLPGHGGGISIGNPSHGTLSYQTRFPRSIVPNVSTFDFPATYTPTPGYVGTDSFTYTALSSQPATVTITVRNDAPTLQMETRCTPSPVVGTTAVLSVLGFDDAGEAGLTYTWSTTGVPPAAPAFSVNGSNVAKTTTATFSRAGTYNLSVAIRDAQNAVVTTALVVVVNQSVAQVTVLPGAAVVIPGGTTTFTAQGVDQFGAVLAVPPAVAWTATGGSISTAGVYVGGAMAGTYTVTATKGSVSAAASVRINAAPTIATAAVATPNPVLGTTAILSVGAMDDVDASGLTYTWSTTGTLPATVGFSANASNAAKSTTVTFAKAGTYGFLATVRDAQGAVVTSPVSVVVNQTLTSIVVTPATGVVIPGGTLACSAQGRDQFGQVLTAQPTFAWTATGGTVTTAGLFTGGATAGGAQVTGSSGGKSGFATVRVNAAPRVATAAKSTPNPVIGTTAVLSVLGTDDVDEAGLTYTWSTTGTVPAAVAFSVNGTNAAKSTTITVTTAGTYGLLATIRDAQGAVVTSPVNVVVSQTLSSIVVSPATSVVVPGGAAAFSAQGRDQFGNALATAPTFGWTATGGAISTAGLFTAGATAGSWGVTASAGGKSGMAAVRVNAAPLVATAAKATPSPVTGSSAVLSVLGKDDVDESGLTYTWSTTGTLPAAVGFSVNGTNAAKSTTVTCTKAGTYGFLVTIQDAQGATVTSPVSVVVNQTLTSVTVSAAVSVVNPGGTSACSAVGRDQFGNLMTPQPTFAWTATGGTISTAGLFTGGATAGTGVATASAGGKSGWASVRINAAPTIANPTKATPNPVTGTTTVLSVLGMDDVDEAGLLYTWSTSSAFQTFVSYSSNGANNSKTTTVTFTKAGTYPFTITIQDAQGATVTSPLLVVVTQTVTSVAVTSATAVVNPGGAATCSAQGFDQFGTVMTVQPVFGWTATGGTVSTTGVFTGGSTAGIAVVTASAGGIAGTATVRVNAAPTVATAAKVAPNPVTGTATVLSVLGTDDVAEAGLTYTWSTTGSVPAAVGYSVNGSNAAKTTTVTFQQAGTYGFLATIQDAQGASVTSPVNVVVNQTLTAVAVTPAGVVVNPSSTAQFGAQGTDQFGKVLTSQPTYTWTATGGTVSTNGLFTGGTTTGPGSVTASAAGKSGTSALRVNASPTVAVAAKAVQDPVTGTTLSALGADDDVESGLTYTWSLTGAPPAAVPFSDNASNSAKSTVAIFSVPGSYAFQVRIADAQGASVTSTVTVTVTSAQTIPPPAPTVQVTVSGGLTGDKQGDWFGQAVSFSNKTSLSVAVSATVSGAAIRSVVLTTSDGWSQTYSAAGTYTVPVPNEGLATISATVTAMSNGMTATGSNTCFVMIDRTPPQADVSLRDGATGSPTLVSDFTPDGVVVLGASGSSAKTVRDTRGFPAFGLDTVQAVVRATDSSGLSQTTTPTAKAGSTALVMIADTTTPGQFICPDFTALPNSVSSDASSLVLSGSGAIPMTVTIRDRCGNSTTGTLCSFWVRRPSARAAWLAALTRTPGALPTNVQLLTDSVTALNPAKLIATPADVLLVDIGGVALQRVDPAPRTVGATVGMPPALWLVPTGIGDRQTASIRTVDIAGNIVVQSLKPVWTDLPYAYPPMKDPPTGTYFSEQWYWHLTGNPDASRQGPTPSADAMNYLKRFINPQDSYNGSSQLLSPNVASIVLFYLSDSYSNITSPIIHPSAAHLGLDSSEEPLVGQQLKFVISGSAYETKTLQVGGDIGSYLVTATNRPIATSGAPIWDGKRYSRPYELKSDFGAQLLTETPDGMNAGQWMAWSRQTGTCVRNSPASWQTNRAVPAPPDIAAHLPATVRLDGPVRGDPTVSGLGASAMFTIPRSVSGGWSRVQWLGANQYEPFPAEDALGHRGLNLLKVVNDVVALSPSMDIRIEGGSLGGSVVFFDATLARQLESSYATSSSMASFYPIIRSEALKNAGQQDRIELDRLRLLARNAAASASGFYNGVLADLKTSLANRSMPNPTRWSACMAPAISALSQAISAEAAQSTLPVPGSEGADFRSRVTSIVDAASARVVAMEAVRSGIASYRNFGVTDKQKITDTYGPQLDALNAKIWAYRASYFSVASFYYFAPGLSDGPPSGIIATFNTDVNIFSIGETAAALDKKRLQELDATQADQVIAAADAIPSYPNPSVGEVIQLLTKRSRTSSDEPNQYALTVQSSTTTSEAMTSGHVQTLHVLVAASDAAVGRYDLNIGNPAYAHALPPLAARRLPKYVYGWDGTSRYDAGESDAQYNARKSAYDALVLQEEQFIGLNGAHRMKEALTIIGVELQEQKRNDDGSVDANTWVKNFSIEQSRPVVRITNPTDGQAIAALSAYDGSRNVTVSGSVRDLGNEISGVVPTLTINGQAVSLTGSGGRLDFSSTVTVQKDGLISAACTDGYGNRGVDEIIISRIATAPLDAVPPANRPTDPAVLNSANGFVFNRSLYSLTTASSGYTLSVRDRITGGQVVIPLASVGSISEPDCDTGTVSIPVYASSDSTWRLEVRSTLAGTGIRRSTMTVTVRAVGRNESLLLIETAVGSGVFVGQQAEVSWSSTVVLSSAVTDAITVNIYKPFAAVITSTLSETGENTKTFTGAGGISITIGEAAGFVSPLVSVTAPALGLTSVPVLTTEAGVGVTNYVSSPLVRQSATPQAGGYGSTEDFRETFAALPLADALPQPRAKRIVMRLPTGTAATKSVKVTTDHGTTHAVVLTKVGDEYQSAPLLFEPDATGPRALGGFPVKYETTGGGAADPSVTVGDDFGVDFEVEILPGSEATGVAARVRKTVVLRRLPMSSDEVDSVVLKNFQSLPGGLVVSIKGVGNARDRASWSARLDKSQTEYLNFEAQAALASQEALDATLTAEAADRAAARAGMANYRGGADGGWTWIGPRGLGEVGRFSQGFAVGTGQQVNETVNPWEIMKGMVALAAFVWETDFSQIDGGELFKQVLFGHAQDMQDAALRGDYYNAGISAGRFMVFFVSLPVSAEIGGATSALARAAAAKLKTVCVGLKVKYTILPPSTSVYVGSTLGAIQGMLPSIARRIRPASFNAVRNRPEGAARVFANKEVMDAATEGRIGGRAQQIDFDGVHPDRFRKDPWTNKSELERGHLIPQRFGGDGSRTNMVPMYWRVNQRLVKEVEDFAADSIAQGKQVEYSILPKYGEHKSIPEQLICVVRVDGKVKLYREIDNVP